MSPSIEKTPSVAIKAPRHLPREPPLEMLHVAVVVHERLGRDNLQPSTIEA